MKKYNANSPASPVKPETIQGRDQVHLGLTKREAFAMAAMQGMSANYISSDWDYKAIAESSVKLADALLKELDK